jgi:ribonucleotide reductase alpha subunit
MRVEVMRHGVRNSLLVAPMPTASTSQILGNTECFEPITSNLYTRRTNAGEFVVINHFLVQELLALGKWNDSMKNSIIANHGSVQHLDLPAEMKKKYLTVWEIPMRHIIDMARDRGAYICQSQSLNLFMADPDPQRLTSMHFYAWKQGLKTGIYYLRRKPRYQPQQVTLDPSVCLTCSA